MAMDSAAAKGAAVIVAGMGREGERERTADDVSKQIPVVKTGD